MTTTDRTSEHDGHLGAGRFRAVTGLSEKALRLYAERGLLRPASVDPVTGYRGYAARQVREGIVMDALRRAHVPLAELSALEDPVSPFSFEDWRGRLAMRRAVEDFYVGVAEHVAGGDAAAFTPVLGDAPPLDWVATDLPLGIPDPAEEVVELMSAMALEAPAQDRLLLDALAEVGVELCPKSWTQLDGTESSPRMRMAHGTPAALDDATRAEVGRVLAARSEGTVRLLVGRLPARRELTFDAPAATPDADPGIVETGDDYLRMVAFAHRSVEWGLRPIGATSRRRVEDVSLFDVASVPTTVFDVAADDGGT